MDLGLGLGWGDGWLKDEIVDELGKYLEWDLMVFFWIGLMD